MQLEWKELKRQLNYDPDNGLFTRLLSLRGHSKAGDICNNRDKRGYIYIKIMQKRYAASRLAYFYMNGNWPPNEIDHINGIPYDNRWINLRTATRMQNARNVSGKKDSSSTHRCVSWRDEKKKWRVRVAYKQYGSFDFETDAAICANYHLAHLFSEFSKLNPISSYHHD